MIELMNQEIKILEIKRIMKLKIQEHNLIEKTFRDKIKKTDKILHNLHKERVNLPNRT